MLASEMLVALQELVDKHGDRELWHEDNECQCYTLSGVTYCKEDDDFKVT